MIGLGLVGYDNDCGISTRKPIRAPRDREVNVPVDFFRLEPTFDLSFSNGGHKHREYRDHTRYTFGRTLRLVTSRY